MTEVTLKEYIEQILVERDKAVNAISSALEKRLDLLNELRGDVVTRTEYTRLHEALVERVREIEISAVKSAVTVSLITSILSGVVVGLLLHYIK